VSGRPTYEGDKVLSGPRGATLISTRVWEEKKRKIKREKKKKGKRKEVRKGGNFKPNTTAERGTGNETVKRD